MKWKDWDRNLKIRLLGEGVINILFWMYFPFMAIYFADSFGKGMAGVLLILSQVFGVVANLMGGYLADHIGRKKMMVASYFRFRVCLYFVCLCKLTVVRVADIIVFCLFITWCIRDALLAC